MRPRFLLPIGILFVACTTNVAPSNRPAEHKPLTATVKASPVNAVASTPVAPTPKAAELDIRSLPLPGANGPVTLDYVTCDRSRRRVWVPVGDTGSVDVFDIDAGTFTRVDGFKTAAREVRGRQRVMGPSSASVGDGVVYIGNRATNEVCSVNAGTLKLGQCLKLPVSIDGISYVASTHEVWVTTPKAQSLTVLDVAKPDTLKAKLVIKTPGAPEGYAIDELRGSFYTNLEDRNETLAIDIKTHTIRGSWNAGCGSDGPRGVAVDSARNFIFVACTESLRILAGANQGVVLGKLDTGAGLDNIEYVDSTQRLYAAAGKAARLTVAHVDDQGQPSVVATAVTAEGARNAVTDAKGTAYVADSRAARLLIIAGAPPISP